MQFLFNLKGKMEYQQFNVKLNNATLPRWPPNIKILNIYIFHSNYESIIYWHNQTDNYKLKM